MEPIEKRTRLIVASALAFALIFSILFSYLPGNLGFSQTAAALGYEDYFDASSLMRVDVTVDADDWQSMLDSAMNETYIECDVALNGERVSSVGIRCKGNSSLSMTEDERYSFKIDFSEYVKKQTFHGLDKMVLNNTQSDNTFIKEYLSYYLLNRAGVKTPLFAMAEIYVNGEYWGLYLAVECIEDSFIERNFSTDGGFLYKPDGTGGMGGGKSENQNGFADFTPPDMSASDVFPQNDASDVAGASNAGDTPPPSGDFSDFTPPNENGGGFNGNFGGSSQSAAALGYLGDDISLYDDIFNYSKTNDPSDSDKERLIAALKAISEGNLDSALDVSGAVSWLAANALLVNDDGYLGNMLHNYYLYEQNGKLTLLPWDYNLAFGGFSGGSATSAVNDPIDTPASSDRPLVTALLSNEDCLEEYHAVLRDLATFLADGSMDALIDELTMLIDESVQNDPTKECTYEEYLTAIDALRSFCTLRGESILGQLDGSIPSTEEGQSEDSSALIQADFNLSDMGAQGGGRGGFNKADFSGERPNSKNRNNDAAASPDKPDGDSTGAQTPPDKPDGDTIASTDAQTSPNKPDGDTTTSTGAQTPPDQAGNDSDDARWNRRAPEGMSFGASSGSTQTSSSIAYAAILDGAAAIALIAALILITRRKR